MFDRREMRWPMSRSSTVINAYASSIQKPKKNRHIGLHVGFGEPWLMYSASTRELLVDGRLVVARMC